LKSAKNHPFKKNHVSYKRKQLVSTSCLLWTGSASGLLDRLPHFHALTARWKKEESNKETDWNAYKRKNVCKERTPKSKDYSTKFKPWQKIFPTKSKSPNRNFSNSMKNYQMTSTKLQMTFANFSLLSPFRSNRNLKNSWIVFGDQNPTLLAFLDSN